MFKSRQDFFLPVKAIIFLALTFLYVPNAEGILRTRAARIKKSVVIGENKHNKKQHGIISFKSLNFLQVVLMLDLYQFLDGRKVGEKRDRCVG